MARIVDLTLTLDDGDRGVSFETARTLAENGWNAKTLHLYSHCGTHMDAPTHFGVNDFAIDRIDVQRLITPARTVNLEPAKPRMLIEPGHVTGPARDIEPGESLIIRTGWSRYYGQPAYRDELPRISEDLAHWCVDQKVAMLAVEPPSVADVNDRTELTAIHRILLAGGVVIVEGLTNLESLTKDRVTLIALPLKIAAGDGAPARVMAIEDQNPH